MTEHARRPLTVVYQYELSEGWIAHAGRTDADNDRLSLHLAGPDDWWFHAHGLPGSHVLLRARADLEPGRAILKEAAAVAAFHSKAREAGLVPVVATLARHVSKPQGAKPGTVTIRKEIIIKVRPAIPGGTPPLPTRL
jgi:predicted ribosome quality control (RQC) complex YloA/Tae2 family protein